MSKNRKPEPLLRSQLGQKRCIKQPGGTTLCVEGKKFGFTGTLIGRSGKGPALPVSTHNLRTGEPARTITEAIKYAEDFLKKTYGRNN